MATTAAPSSSASSARFAGRGGAARRADSLFRGGLTATAGLVLVLIVVFLIFLFDKAHIAFSHQGFFSFIFHNDWTPSQQVFGAWPLIVGTLITAVIALVIGVPIAVATALFITELCPTRFRTPITILVELLAAVPSVVYGLWGLKVLAPHLLGTEKWFSDKLGFLPFVGGTTVSIPNYFVAGLVLAIMILPIVSAISREVISTVPADHKEAALALGMTRWEMIRVAVIPYSRSGITGGAMLGLGRAVGETVAVAILIGQVPSIGKQLFAQGSTLAAQIVGEFGEASSDKLHSGALIACGLVLFVITLVINGLARYLVIRAERIKTAPAAANPPAAGVSAAS